MISIILSNNAVTVTNAMTNKIAPIVSLKIRSKVPMFFFMFNSIPCYRLIHSDILTHMHPHTTIGHVHLTVADLDRSLAFYRDILGFTITAKYGDSAVFLSAGGYHHHIGLNTWAGKGVLPPPKGHSGLYHVAILLPSRLELAKCLKRLMDAGYPISGAADHGVSEALYLEDPDDIGIELYCDRPRETWTVTNDGLVEMVTEKLDIEGLLAELD